MADEKLQEWEIRREAKPGELVPGVKLKMADGREYEVPPIGLLSVKRLQTRLESWTGGIDEASVSTCTDAVLAALKRNYPKLTRADIFGEMSDDFDVTIPAMVDVGNMRDVMQAVMDVGGMMRKEQQQGEAVRGNL